MINNNNNSGNYEHNVIDRRRYEISKRIANLEQRLQSNKQQEESIREPIYENIKGNNNNDGIIKETYQRRVIPTYDQPPMKMIKSNNNNNIGRTGSSSNQGYKYVSTHIPPPPPSNSSEIQKLHNLVKSTIEGQTAIQRQLYDLRIRMQGQQQDQQNQPNARQKQRYRELSPKRLGERTQEETTPVDKLSSNYERDKGVNRSIVETAPFNPVQNLQNQQQKQSFSYVPPQRIMNLNDKQVEVRRKNTVDLPRSTNYYIEPEKKNNNNYLMDNRRNSQNPPSLIVEQKLEDNKNNKRNVGQIISGRDNNTNLSAYNIVNHPQYNKIPQEVQIPLKREIDKIAQGTYYNSQNQKQDKNYNRSSLRSGEQQQQIEQKYAIKKHQSGSNSKEGLKRIVKKEIKQQLPQQKQKISRSREQSPTKYDFLREYEYLKNSEERAAKSQSQYESKRNRGGTAFEEMKISISKKIKIRLRESEENYKDSSHKNAKHQHHHLLNTFELQKKLRDDMIRRVHQMQDVKRYK